MELKTDSAEIGRRIKEIRNKFGYTREEFSERLGVSPQFIANIEQGRRRLSYDNLAKLCGLTCVSSDFILFGKRDEDEHGGLSVILENLPPEHIRLIEDIVVSYVKGINLDRQ